MSTFIHIQRLVLMSKHKKSIHVLLIIVASTLMLVFSSSCRRSEEVPSIILGKYRLFSSDPSLQRFIQNENNFIEIKKDNTITYHSTINGKEKFNFSGDFIYDKINKKLSIEWKAGKLPSTLKIDKTGDDHIIWINETAYVKEKK